MIEIERLRNFAQSLGDQSRGQAVSQADVERQIYAYVAAWARANQEPPELPTKMLTLALQAFRHGRGGRFTKGRFEQATFFPLGHRINTGKTHGEVTKR